MIKNVMYSWCTFFIVLCRRLSQKNDMNMKTKIHKLHLIELSECSRSINLLLFTFNWINWDHVDEAYHKKNAVDNKMMSAWKRWNCNFMSKITCQMSHFKIFKSNYHWFQSKCNQMPLFSHHNNLILKFSVRNDENSAESDLHSKQCTKSPLN
jgi:hypothetical protein